MMQIYKSILKSSDRLGWLSMDEPIRKTVAVSLHGSVTYV